MKRYNIFDEMRRMQNEMDRLFGSFFSEPFEIYDSKRPLLDFSGNENQALIKSNYKNPLTDFYETENEFIANIEIPGVNKKDIMIDTKDNKLSLKVEKTDETKDQDKKKGTYRFERTYNGFYKSFSLPENTDTENINAEYKDGMLKIKIPKKEIEGKKRKLIEVK